jgi:hypothetical protein
MSPVAHYPTARHVGGDVVLIGGRLLGQDEARRLRLFHLGEATRCTGEAKAFHERCSLDLLKALMEAHDWHRAATRRAA